MIRQIETTIEDLYNFYKLYPEYKGLIEVETRKGFYAVEECDITAINSDIIQIQTQSDKILKGSPDHNLLDENENWKSIKNLSLNDKIQTKDGLENIKSIEKLNYKDDLYDLQVAEVHEFYANGIVSHNSTLIEALSFCLYGQPYRKIKIASLINDKNQSNLLVSCKFTVDSKDRYEIIRGLSPDIIKIIKNDQELELLSSKRLNQDEIDSIIGINYQMFKQVISLAVSYNKPFLSMTAAEKRDIIEQIFNIKVFGYMLKILKKNNVETRLKNEVNDKTILILEESLKSFKQQLHQTTENSKNFQTNKEKDLNDAKIRIEKYSIQNQKIDEKIEKINNELKIIDFDIESLKKAKTLRNKQTKEINQKDYYIKVLKQNIDLLTNHEICPTCKTEITPEHKEAEINKINKEITEIQIKIGEIRIEKDQNEIKIHNLEKSDEKIKELNHQLDNLNNQLKIIQNELKNAENRKTEIEQREIDFNLEALNKEFNTKKDDYRTIWKENKLVKKKLKNNDVVQNILSENGIRAFFFRRLVPILNNKINEYLRLFELPVLLQFDEFMNEKITNLNNLQKEVSYFSYSEGEKKRFDMSILLAFISITKIISNWNTNILMIDELVDSAIDENGLNKLISSLKNMRHDNQNLCIYIISHRLQQDYNSQFNKCYEITKNFNSFSEIKEITNG
jgi:DNA repair exonuclease SbcCD ATPase subunit